MKLITIQSTLNVVMGLLDDEGDVVQQIPLQVIVPKLDEESLRAVLQEVKAKRADIESKIPVSGGSGLKGEEKEENT